MREQISISVPGRVLLLAALAVSIATFFWLGNSWPFTDEGSYLAVGWGLSKGLRLYRDLVNEKAPLLYEFLSLLFSVTGPQYLWARAASLLATLVSLGVIFGYLRRRAGELGAGVVALAFAMAAPRFGATHVIAEPYVSLCFLIAFVFLKKARSGDKRSWFFAGTIAGAALCIKQQAAPFALALLAGSVQTPEGGRQLRAMLRTAFGLLVIPAACAIGFAVRGTLVDAFRATIVFPLFAFDHTAYARGIETGALQGAGLFIVAAAIAGFGALATQEYWHARRVELRDYLLLLVGALLMAVPRFDAHRLLPALGLLVLPLGLLFKERGQRLWAVLVAALLVVSAWPLVAFYRTRHMEDGFAPIRRVAATIRNQVDEDDRIYVYPHNAYLYFFSSRLPASRYYWVLPWSAVPSWREGTLEDFAATPPSLIVEVFGDLAAVGKVSTVSYAAYLNVYRDDRCGFLKEVPNAARFYDCDVATGSSSAME